MKIFVAVTDKDWFDFLSGQPQLDEVNFWRPSDTRKVRTIIPGEPWLFKLHSPLNYIVGGGRFIDSSAWPHRMAWNFFGIQNGAASFPEFEQRIEKYRAPDPFKNYDIGCIMLSQPFFFRRQDWFPVPEDWPKNLQGGKTYSTDETLGRELWDQVAMRLQARGVAEPDTEQPDLHGDPILHRPRLGQGSFRAVITDTYSRRCAVTGEKALPVLDAAHIRPVSEGGDHVVHNGLLLRSDVHRLFDSGYVTVSPDYRFRVSGRLKTEFDNGEPYYPLEGREITLPDPALLPDRQTLEWHSDAVFRG